MLRSGDLFQGENVFGALMPDEVIWISSVGGRGPWSSVRRMAVSERFVWCMNNIF